MPVALLAVVVSGFAPTALIGASSPKESGTLTICKNSKNGMAGRSFQFSVDGAAGVTVVGGGCSGPIAATAGAHTVVEAATPGLQVAKIAANHKVSVDLGSGTVAVKVRAGSATLVTYTNRKVPAVGLKICNATVDATLIGDLFDFTQNGGKASSVSAGTPTAPNCSPVTKYPVGTVVNVAAAPIASVWVLSITVSDNRGSNFDTNARTVTATIGTGVTVVTYTHMVAHSLNIGLIEVCKQAADEGVTGTFDFTITAPGFTANRTMAVGQCTEPFQVPGGNVTVRETERSPYSVSAITAAPANRLVSTNLVDQTVIVVVSAGLSSTKTTVTFTNASGITVAG